MIIIIQRHLQFNQNSEIIYSFYSCQIKWNIGEPKTSQFFSFLKVFYAWKDAAFIYFYKHIDMSCIK